MNFKKYKRLDSETYLPEVNSLPWSFYPSDQTKNPQQQNENCYNFQPFGYFCRLGQVSHIPICNLSSK